MNTTTPAAFRHILTGLAVWIGFFAGWTLVSIPLTLAGAPFAMLALAAVSGLATAWAAWRLRGPIALSLDTSFVPITGLPALPGKPRLAVLAAGGLIFAGAAAYFVKSSNADLLWAVCLGLSALSLLWSPAAASTPGDDVPQGTVGNLGLGFIILSVVICGLYLVVLRPDADDAFYLNLPIGLKAATQGMMVADTMYGLPDWPILGSNYRIETLPTLVAGISWLTGLSVLSVAHGLLPLIWCLSLSASLIVIGYGLFRQYWFIFAAIFILMSLGLAGSLQNWGVHGIFRLFHGKGPLLNIIVPLMIFVVLQYDRRKIAPGLAFTILLTLQMASVGLTANAVYIAPLALGLAIAAVSLPRLRDIWRNIRLMPAVAPPVLAGLYLFLFDRPVSNQELGSGIQRDLALWDMANDKYLLGFLLALLFAAAVAGILARRNRWVSAYLLVGLVFIFNPFMWPYYGRYVTGDLNFRLYWAVPAPMFIALFGTAIIIARNKMATGAVWAICVVLVVMPLSIFRTEGTRIMPTTAKVPPTELRIVRQAHDLVPPGMAILAPEAVAAWLAIEEGHARPAYTRRLYLEQSGPAMDAARLAPHVILADWINMIATPPPAAAITSALGNVCVGLIVLGNDTPAHIDALLAQKQATLVAENDGYRFLQTAQDCTAPAS